MLNGLDLFAGIGGIALGLERAGLVKPRIFVEFDKYAQQVLKLRFPETAIWDDVRTFDGKPWRGKIDFISGGFPCQDISVAGKRTGLSGKRSGLWSEFRRIIDEIRPRFALVENVPNLLVLGFGQVLADLCEIGYDAEWMLLSAKDMGAPHLRKRLFVLAYAERERYDRRGEEELMRQENAPETARRNRPNREWWKIESELCRVVDELPHRVDRLKCLGNAVVPACAEYIGWLIKNYFEKF